MNPMLLPHPLRGDGGERGDGSENGNGSVKILNGMRAGAKGGEESLLEYVLPFLDPSRQEALG